MWASASQSWAQATCHHRPLRQRNEPRVLNQTRAFQLISQKRDDKHFLLTLKNGYSKNINGYTVTQGLDTSTSARVSIEEDFIFGDKLIAPGETYVVRIPISEHAPASGSVYQQEQDINVAAVIFDDGTGDGDSNVIKRTKERRRGERIQLEHILPLFQAVLDSQDADLPAAVDNLESRIASLPKIAENELSPSVKSGLQGVKEMLLQAAQTLKRNSQRLSHLNLREELTKVTSHYEKVKAKLRDL